MRNSAPLGSWVIACENSATVMSRRGESSSSLNTPSWSFPRAKSRVSVEAVERSMSSTSSEALFSGKNIMSRPMSLKRSLFSGDRKSSSSTRATTRLVPSFLARRALTMFTLWGWRGLTAMKRSADVAPASFKSGMDDGPPRMVATSAVWLRERMRSGSGSMTVISLDSLESIFARCAPTCPAPSMIIFIP